MPKTQSMTRNQNHYDDASSSRKRPNNCAPWSDLNHDLLHSVMMKLGFRDYYSFRGVCKSWRLLADSNKNRFMASIPPMSITISTDSNEKVCCYLEDIDGRKFKIILPDFAGGDCIGVTCGYLIFFIRETETFWLVNPITRHQLHFPHFPYYKCLNRLVCKAILVFSASISEWVLVVMFKYSYIIWFSRAGKEVWNHVSYHDRITDIYAFRGEIYTLICDNRFHLCEVRLGPQPKLRLLAIKKPVFFNPDEVISSVEFISSYENLYAMYYTPKDPNIFLELDVGEMKWVKVCEKTMEKYSCFYSDLNNAVANKRESWTGPWSHRRYVDTQHNGRIWFFTKKMWYYPQKCMDVDRID